MGKKPLRASGPSVVEMSLPEIRGEIELPFTVDMSGSGSGVSLSIADNSGTMTLRGGPTIQILAYGSLFWQSQNRMVVQLIGLTGSQVMIASIYCDPNKQKLTNIWYEFSDHPGMISGSLSGTCTTARNSHRVSYDFPAANLVKPVSYGIETADGPDLKLQGPGGTLQHGSNNGSLEPFDAFPFGSVNCRDCGGKGWYELHSMFYDQARTRACFAILYFMLGDPHHVGMTWGVCLNGAPDEANLDLNFNSQFDADWTWQR